MRFLVDLLTPLTLAARDRDSLAGFMRQLGWRVTFQEAHVTKFREAMAILDEVEDIVDWIEDLDVTELGLAAAEELRDRSRGVLNAIRALGQLTPAQQNAILQLPEPFNSPATWGTLALRLPDHLLFTWLEVHQEALFETLRAVGLIRLEPVPDAEPESDGTVLMRFAIAWDELAGFIADPGDLVARSYDWGGAFRHDLLIERLTALLIALGFDLRPAPVRPELRLGWDAAGINAGSAQELEFALVDWQGPTMGLGFRTDIVLAPFLQNGALSGLRLTNFTDGTLDTVADLGEGWQFSAEATGDLDQALALTLDPSGLAFDTDLTGSNAAATLLLEGAPEVPWRLIGGETGPRLELSRLTVEIATDISAQRQTLSLRATTAGTTPGLRLVIAPGEGDSFVSEVLGAQELDITGDVGALWNSENGLTLEGGVGFDVTVPLDVTLGPIHVTALHLALQGDTQGLSLDAAVSGGFDLSVLAVALEEIGVSASAVQQAMQDPPGLLGPVDIGRSFKPPKGMGLAVDAAGILTGGGYLFHDAEAGEYAGVAELGFLSVRLSAIGILTTQMSDGSDGWSLFLSVFSEFPPIQIGFGVTLMGVGGLVGVHRTFDDTALRDRLLSGALDSIMFPDDPVANAPRILDDIRAVFPPSAGQFVFGAMLKLGWGTPSVLTLDLGVIVELPDPLKIALLGQLNLSLPKPDKTIIELNMDMFGVVNLTEGTIAVDATIRDSHILNLLTLSGDMAFRARFGDAPTMLMSVGGFHPKFTPPPGVPNLRRMRASLPLGDKAAVDLLAYVAVTSNTFQAGGRIDVWVRALGFTAEGYFGFDALIQFSPFGFDFFVTFGVTIRAGRTTLMGVDVAASIIGPGPWVIEGYAEFKILGVKKKLNVDIEVGQRKMVPVPVYDVEALLIAALEDAAAWQVADLPQATNPVVLREPDADEVPRVHPGGAVSVRQNVVPLYLKIDRFGAGRVEGRTLFEIASTRIGTGTDTFDADKLLGDWFAPAEYIDMKDPQKLKAPAYEFFDAGVEIGGGGTHFGTDATREEAYEEILLDPALNQRTSPKKRRPADATKDLLSELRPNVPEAKSPILALKEAPTAFAETRLMPRRRRVA